jgi:hypothetical protein
MHRDKRNHEQRDNKNFLLVLLPKLPHASFELPSI